MEPHEVARALDSTDRGKIKDCVEEISRMGHGDLADLMERISVEQRRQILNELEWAGKFDPGLLEFEG